MRKNGKSTGAIFAIAMAITLVACEKETEEAAKEQLLEMAAEEQMLSATDAEIEDMAFVPMHPGEPGMDCLNWRRKLPDCAVITSSGNSYPRTITIDFGDGCKSENGKEKKGKIIMTISDDLREPGATRTVRFENFAVHERAISGKMVLTNQGQNKEGQWTFNRSGQMTITGAKGQTERKVEGTLVWLEGFGDGNCENNVLSISGTTTVKGWRGQLTRTITQPLIRDFSCKHFTAGQITIEGKRGTGIIDFGDGSCDNVATLTKDGETREINLDEHRCRKRNRRHAKP